MPDLALDPQLLASKPEVVIAVMGAKFDALRDAVVGRMDAADARHREFEHTVREMIHHEAANRKMADEAIRREVQEVDDRKVIEQPHLEALNKRYEDGIAVLRSNTLRLDEVERAMDRRRTTEKVVIGAGGLIAATVTWAVNAIISAGYLHH